MIARKLLGIALAAALLVGLTASPAFAARHAQNCTVRNTGNQSRQICAYVNTRDITLQTEGEGLADLYEFPFVAHVYIQIDFVKLYQCPTPGNCTLRRSWNGPANFFEAATCDGQNGCDDTRGTSDGSGWWPFCASDGGGHAGTFHGDIRFRLKWVDQAGDPIGPWVLLHSGNSIETCGL